VETALQIATAFILAAGWTWVNSLIELAERNEYFVRNNWFFWIHGVLYGAIALVVLFGVGLTADSGPYNVPFVDVTSPLLRAVIAVVVVFVARRVLMTTFQIPKVVRIFGWEKKLSPKNRERLETTLNDVKRALLFIERRMRGNYRLSVFTYASQRAAQYPDVDEVRRRVKQHLPATTMEAEAKALIFDAMDPVVSPDSESIMVTFLDIFGKAVFDVAFPERDGAGEVVGAQES
jgi:hypothetical protein